MRHSPKQIQVIQDLEKFLELVQPIEEYHTGVGILRVALKQATSQSGIFADASLMVCRALADKILDDIRALQAGQR